MGRAAATVLFVSALPAVGAPPSAPVFTDVTREAGIAFRHVHGGTGEKFMCETMGGGVAFLDMDGDGDLDLLFVQSGPLPGRRFEGKGRADFPNALYDNLGNGTFRDVTKGSGIEGKGYGMGAAVGDYDGDGRPDVYITCFGADELYRNMGGGRFRDATREAGIGNALWGASAAFADLDDDGHLDLYVTNYVDHTMQHNVWCGEHKEGMRAYCHPDAYHPLPHVLYRNRGDGTFEDVTRKAGVDLRDGAGLGVVAGDYDGDGLLDLYVANDSTRNFLLHNVSVSKGGKRAMRLEDDTLVGGAGYSESGKAEAGMGVDMGDADGDGKLDLFVTNLDLEPNELYVNRGDGSFKIATFPSGLGEVSVPFVGFGAGLVDLDNDGDLDVFVGNGHIIDNVPLYRKGATYAQRKLLFLNDGHGRFTEVAEKAGAALAAPQVTRGVAFGDYDNDGDIDIAAANNNAPAVLLRNDGLVGKSVLLKANSQNGEHDSFGMVAKDLRRSPPEAARPPALPSAAAGGRAVTLVLKGKGSNTQGLGARVTAVVGSRTIVREARTGYSYLAANDPRVHLGLGGEAKAAHISVRWLSGKTSELRDVKPGFVTVPEP